MYRSLNAKVLGIRENERITILFSNGRWQVRRCNGEANPLISQQVLNCLRYSPDLDRYYIGGPIVKTGAQFIVRH